MYFFIIRQPLLKFARNARPKIYGHLWSRKTCHGPCRSRRETAVSDRPRLSHYFVLSPKTETHDQLSCASCQFEILYRLSCPIFAAMSPYWSLSGPRDVSWTFFKRPCYVWYCALDTVQGNLVKQFPFHYCTTLSHLFLAGASSTCLGYGSPICWGQA